MDSSPFLSMRLPYPPPRSVGGRTGRPRGLCQALRYGEQDVGVGPDRTGRGRGMVRPAAMCSAMAKCNVVPRHRRRSFSRSPTDSPACMPPKSPCHRCSPAGTPPFPQRVILFLIPQCLTVEKSCSCDEVPVTTWQVSCAVEATPPTGVDASPASRRSGEGLPSILYYINY